MAGSRDIGLKGGPELLAFLEAFPAKLQKGAIRSALTAAAKPVRDQARANAPRQTGKLRKAIKTGSPRVESDGTVRIKVRLAGEHSYLGTFFEYGISAHLIAVTGAKEGRRAVAAAKGGGKKIQGGVMKIGQDFVSGIISHPGVAAKPFLRPALDTRADDAIKAYGDRIRTYLSSKTNFTAPALLTEVEEG